MNPIPFSRVAPAGRQSSPHPAVLRLILLLALSASVSLLPACASAAPSMQHGPEAGSRDEFVRQGYGPGRAGDTTAEFDGGEMRMAGMVANSPSPVEEAAGGRSSATRLTDRGPRNGNYREDPTADAAEPQPAAEAPVRREFPETMVVEPMLITDADGKVTIGVERMPDSITTWKVRAIAHSIDGAFGEGSGTFRVFRDIFLNLQLPRVLTVGDDLYVPLTVMNYSAAAIDVQVSIQREAWLELDGEGAYRFGVDARSANKQYARLKMLAAGDHTITVRANAGTAADRVQMPVRVEPRGIKRTITQRVSLTGSQRLDLRFASVAPPDASDALAAQLNAAAHREVEITITPTLVSQLLLARDGLLRRPTGCLEQTLSTTLVDVEIARALQQLGDDGAPQLAHAQEILQQAWQTILGYYDANTQRFGSWPGQYVGSFDGWLNAWALYAMRGMSAVGVTVDPEFVKRLEDAIVDQLDDMDGSTRAIALWALLADTRRDGALVKSAWPRVDAQLARYRSSRAAYYSNYELALLMNVMAAAGDADHLQIFYDGLLGRLDFSDSDLPQFMEDVPDGHTLTHARGASASDEIAALMLLALTSVHQIERPVTDKLAQLLLQARAADNIWSTTFATGVGYRALAQLDAQQGVRGATTIAGRFNAQSFGPVQVGDAAKLLPITQTFIANPVNTLELTAQGLVDVQVTRRMWFPDVASYPTASQAFDLRVQAGSQTLRQGETTALSFQVKRRAWNPVGPDGGFAFHEWWPGSRYTAPPSGSYGNPVMVIIGVPDTLRVFEDSLQAWKDSGSIARYELTGREIRLYFNDLPGQGFSGQLTLFAQNPGTVTAPASTAWEYYNPDGAGIAPPLTFTVTR